MACGLVTYAMVTIQSSVLNNITINERRVTSFYKFGGVLIPGGQLKLLQDQHNPSLRGCSRVARQAPMPLFNVGSGQARPFREEGNMLALSIEV